MGLFTLPAACCGPSKRSQANGQTAEPQGGKRRDGHRRTEFACESRSIEGRCTGCQPRVCEPIFDKVDQVRQDRDGYGDWNGRV